MVVLRRCENFLLGNGGFEKSQRGAASVFWGCRLGLGGFCSENAVLGAEGVFWRLWPAFGFGPFLWPSSELAIAES